MNGLEFTSRTFAVLAAATLCGGLGMWLLLPRGNRHGRLWGAALGLVSLLLLAAEMPPLGDLTADVVFYGLAAVTIVSAVATVTFRSPVYCAIWFALSLLGTAALFLFQGAQFLGVATVVVYAGAILVTFLFVLMLAQPQGDAFYDRISWEGPLAAATGAILVGLLTLTIVGVFRPVSGEPPAAPFTGEQLSKQVLSPDHMAHLGGELFSRYLIAVEVAGTLLLVALVGAVAILARAGGTMASSHQAAMAPLRIKPSELFTIGGGANGLGHVASPIRSGKPASGKEVHRG